MSRAAPRTLARERQCPVTGCPYVSYDEQLVLVRPARLSDRRSDAALEHFKQQIAANHPAYLDYQNPWVC